MRRPDILAGCLIATLAAAAPVQARADAISLLSGFNAVVFGNFSTSADVEGRTVIGGDLSGNGSFAIDPLTGSSSYDALTVYGNGTNGGWHNVTHGGVTIQGSNNGNFTLNGTGNAFVGAGNSGSITTSNGSIAVLGTNNAPLTANGSGQPVYVGASNSGTVTVAGGNVGINGDNAGELKLNNNAAAQVNGNDTANVDGGSLAYTGTFTGNANGGATVTHVSSVSLTAPTSPLPNFDSTFKNPLTQLSTQLASLTSTSSVQTSSNQATLVAVPNDSGQAVLNVTSGLFTANTQIVVDLGSATSLIINVTIPGCSGSNCSLTIGGNGMNFQDPTGVAPYVLWNFTNATTLDIATEIGGTVLSPYATVANTAPIDGTLVADSFNGSGELHNYPFVGQGTSGSGSGVPLPEPPSLILLLPGLAAIGVVRFRGRRHRTEA